MLEIKRRIKLVAVFRACWKEERRPTEIEVKRKTTKRTANNKKIVGRVHSSHAYNR